MDNHELTHFGIPGMKWGKRNGPPYPLDKVVTKAMKSGYNAGISNYSAQTAQTIVNKVSGKDKKKENVGVIAKRILAGAAMVAATNMLANVIEPISRDLIEKGATAAKYAVLEMAGMTPKEYIEIPLKFKN